MSAKDQEELLVISGGAGQYEVEAGASIKVGPAEAHVSVSRRVTVSKRVANAIKRGARIGIRNALRFYWVIIYKFYLTVHKEELCVI